jgi:hypothetical protein
MEEYGFIITRHVNSDTTNKYWNNNVYLLNKLYPGKPIVIIDDNSDARYVKQEREYANLTIIQSEFPGRGELLPYYYYLQHKFFRNAVIIHDSVFIHKRIQFEKLQGEAVVPLWFFPSDRENVDNSIRIASKLKHSYTVNDKLKNETELLGFITQKWYGCFGVQAYIQLSFLEHLEAKYGITRLIPSVVCRKDRCCLERIFGVLFFTEYPALLKNKSLLGNIMSYVTWGYTYERYIQDIANNRLPREIVKVWTGR